MRTFERRCLRARRPTLESELCRSRMRGEYVLCISEPIPLPVCKALQIFKPRSPAFFGKRVYIFGIVYPLKGDYDGFSTVSSKPSA